MKLLTKTTLYIATLSLFLFFFMGIIFFHILKNMSLADLDRELANLKEQVDIQLVSDPASVPGHISGIDTLTIQFEPSVPKFEEKYVDTLMFDNVSNQFRTYRCLAYTIETDNGLAMIKIFKSTTPADQLVERVTLMMTIMVILFLAGVFLLNRYVFANLWKDFFDALKQLREFDTAKEPVVLGHQDIEEFAELKIVLEKMTRQLSRDYRELKEYTDHTTHELQTPLAVIKSKADLLIQSENLGQDEMKLIQAINVSTNQLSRLNSTLTLITRIENNQFTETREIDLIQLLEKHLDMLQELVEVRGIELKKLYTSKTAIIVMDEGLADILVANLLKNAIVHNVDGGSIDLKISPNSFLIANEGPPISFKQDEIFHRFVRNQGESKGFGLGLSLAKKISESYGFNLSYGYENERHFFTLEWNS